MAQSDCIYHFSLHCFFVFFLVARRVEMVMHVMQMTENRRWDETHVTVEFKKKRRHQVTW